MTTGPIHAFERQGGSGSTITRSIRLNKYLHNRSTANPHPLYFAHMSHGLFLSQPPCLCKVELECLDEAFSGTVNANAQICDKFCNISLLLRLGTDYSKRMTLVLNSGMSSVIRAPFPPLSRKGAASQPHNWPDL